MIFRRLYFLLLTISLLAAAAQQSEAADSSANVDSSLFRDELNHIILC